MNEAAAAVARRLQDAYGRLDAQTTLRHVLLKEFPQRIAMVSSFGAESAVLLDMVAAVNPHVLVLFLETGKLFAQTIQYKDALVRRLGLSDVRVLRPDSQGLEFLDADGTLWQRNPDGCCFLRKTVPLEQGLSGFDAWISGRKRFHGGARSAMPVFEAQDGRIKINPLGGLGPAGGRRLVRCARSAAPSAGRDGVRVDRLSHLHAARGGRRGCARRAVGRPWQDRVRDPQPSRTPGPRRRDAADRRIVGVRRPDRARAGGHGICIFKHAMMRPSKDCRSNRNRTGGAL